MSLRQSRNDYLASNSHHSHHHHHNNQSPSHVKVQRSVSATNKPRRFSHDQAAAVAGAQGNSNAAGTGAAATATGSGASGTNAANAGGQFNNQNSNVSSTGPSGANVSSATSPSSAAGGSGTGSSAKTRPSAFEHISKDTVIYKNNGDVNGSQNGTASGNDGTAVLTNGADQSSPSGVKSPSGHGKQSNVSHIKSPIALSGSGATGTVGGGNSTASSAFGSASNSHGSNESNASTPAGTVLSPSKLSQLGTGSLRQKPVPMLKQNSLIPTARTQNYQTDKNGDKSVDSSSSHKYVSNLTSLRRISFWFLSPL